MSQINPAFPTSLYSNHWTPQYHHETPCYRQRRTRTCPGLAAAQSERIQKVYVAPGNGGTATTDLLENVDLTAADDLIAFAITEAFGERCPTTDAHCYTCQAWSQYDALRAAATPSAEVSVEELAAIIEREIVAIIHIGDENAEIDGKAAAAALLGKYRMEKR